MHSIQSTQPYRQEPIASQTDRTSTHREPITREAAIQLMQSLQPGDRLHEEINRFLVLRKTGIIELTNGLKINMRPDNERLLGGMLQAVVTVLTVKNLCQGLTLATLLYTITGITADLFQRISNWFQGNGFKSNDQIHAIDFRAIAQHLPREAQLVIAHKMGLNKL